MKRRPCISGALGSLGIERSLTRRSGIEPTHTSLLGCLFAFSASMIPTSEGYLYLGLLLGLLDRPERLDMTNRSPRHTYRRDRAA
jgi:hypothetical protein